MYGLPADFDASPFVGRELTQVSFCKFSLQFVFGESPSGDISIMLQSAFAYRPHPSAPEVYQTIPAATSAVTELIGQCVSGANGTRDGTLTLSFEGGAVLQILDSLPNYESYKIRGPWTSHRLKNLLIV